VKSALLAGDIPAAWRRTSSRWSLRSPMSISDPMPSAMGNGCAINAP